MLAQVLASVRATLTRAVGAARSIAAAVIAAAAIAEPKRSLAQLIGDRATQQISAHNYAAGNHCQEQGVLDRRDAVLVGPQPGQESLGSAHAGSPLPRQGIHNHSSSWRLKERQFYLNGRPLIPDTLERISHKRVQSRI